MYPRAEVIHGDVRELRDLLQKSGVTQLDAIISGLPVLLLPDDIVTAYYRAVLQLLDARKPFVQFTYSAYKFRARTQHWLTHVHQCKRVLWNWPPAYVLTLTVNPKLSAATPTAS